MLISEEKSLVERNYKTFILQNSSQNFIILNDIFKSINIKIKKIIKNIKKYSYNVKVFNISILAKKVIKCFKKDNIYFDTVLTVGTGGKHFLDSIKNDKLFLNKEIINLDWHRHWDNQKSLGFETDISTYDLKNKKILIMEDVIASGMTLVVLKEEIEKRGGEVVAINASLIQEASFLKDKSIVPTYVAVKINKPNDIALDPFWYPPIYSLRHLLYGDMEMSSFYKILNEKYFNNENKIEKMIKKYREKETWNII